MKPGVFEVARRQMNSIGDFSSYVLMSLSITSYGFLQVYSSLESVARRFARAPRPYVASRVPELRQSVPVNKCILSRAVCPNVRRISKAGNRVSTLGATHCESAAIPFREH